jgi:uncharacterized protein (TIGR02271 family)
MADKQDRKKDPEKTVDLPPKGPRNPDPITDAPGSHPIETGIGATIGGIASGMAVGTLTGGPVGAVIGAIAGGAALGGLAGKGIGELIDPTTEDNWIREYYGSEKSHPAGTTHETYRPAYRYGLEAGTRHTGKRFDDVETDLRADWERSHAASGLTWDRARGAVRHAFDRTIQLREEQLKVDKHREQTGEVQVRKEVVTERQQVSVPVEREEVVIERRPAHGQTAGSIKAEEIRIPVSEEKVNVDKETVVKEEVKVGKRTVQDTKTVSGEVKREELRVEEKGDVNVKGNPGKPSSR